MSYKEKIEQTAQEMHSIFYIGG